MSKRELLAVVLAAAALLVPAQARDFPGATGKTDASSDVILAPTPHPRLPSDLNQLWFVPAEAPRSAATPLNVALRQYADGEYAKALPVLSRAAFHQGTLGPHVMYA